MKRFIKELLAALFLLFVSHCGGISRHHKRPNGEPTPNSATQVAKYSLLYGSMLGQNVIMQHPSTFLGERERDVLSVVQELMMSRGLPTAEKECSPMVIQSFRKERLLHSLDGRTPLKVTYTTNEAGYLQRVSRQVVLGCTFTISGGFLGERYHQQLNSTRQLASLFERVSLASLEGRVNSNKKTLRDCHTTIVDSEGDRSCVFTAPQLSPSVSDFSSFHNITSTHLRGGPLIVFSHTWTRKESVFSWDSPFSGCQGDKFTIATQNIWNFNEYQSQKYRDRISKLGQILRQESPDVLALQEVRLDARRDGRLGPSQIKHLLAFFKGYQYVYQPAMLDSNTAFVRVEEGVAILSRYPIVWWTYQLLSRNHSNVDDIHQRILLHAVINTPQLGRVNVFNTHLSLEENARLRSVIEICRYMSKFSGPKFLLGDLNTVPHSAEMAFLRGEKSLNGTRCTGYADAWRHGPSYRDASLLPWQRAGLTFNSADTNLSKRIDYIYASTSRVDGNRSMDILNVKTFGSPSPLPASDHLGVLLTVKC